MTSKSGIATRRQHFTDTIPCLHDRHVEGATTKIEHQKIRSVLPLKSIRKSSHGWLIGYSQHLQSSNAACILRGLPLGIIKIGWHSDHSLLHFRLQEFCSIRSKLPQNMC
mmetsp:Transcript_3136/g.7068  ORF Transcript_3136/g.7068 Transcript_3136/m.7068 type:complete len:110 (+) Transcript_3136:1305-1634(+)